MSSDSKKGSGFGQSRLVTWEYWGNMQVILDGKQIIYHAPADGVQRVYLQKVHIC